MGYPSRKILNNAVDCPQEVASLKCKVVKQCVSNVMRGVIFFRQLTNSSRNGFFVVINNSTILIFIIAVSTADTPRGDHWKTTHHVFN